MNVTFESDTRGPDILATVRIQGQDVTLRTSREFEEFMDSVLRLEPEQMFEQSVWLLQMSKSLASGVKYTRAILVLGRVIVPRATPEANRLLDSLREQDLDELHREATASFLEVIAKGIFQRAVNLDPSLGSDELE